MLELFRVFPFLVHCGFGIRNLFHLLFSPFVVFSICCFPHLLFSPFVVFSICCFLHLLFSPFVVFSLSLLFSPSLCCFLPPFVVLSLLLLFFFSLLSSFLPPFLFSPPFLFAHPFLQHAGIERFRSAEVLPAKTYELSDGSHVSSPLAITVAVFGGMSCTRLDRYRAHHQAQRSGSGTGMVVRVGGNEGRVTHQSNTPFDCDQIMSESSHARASEDIGQRREVDGQPSAESSQGTLSHHANCEFLLPCVL